MHSIILRLTLLHERVPLGEGPQVVRAHVLVVDPAVVELLEPGLVLAVHGVGLLHVEVLSAPPISQVHRRALVVVVQRRLLDLGSSF